MSIDITPAMVWAKERKTFCSVSIDFRYDVIADSCSWSYAALRKCLKSSSPTRMCYMSGDIGHTEIMFTAKPV